MSFYTICMRNSSLILFWMAVVLFLLGLVSPFFAYEQLQAMGNDQPIEVNVVVTAVVQALSIAVWPFFGAGLIWSLQSKRAEAVE